MSEWKRVIIHVSLVVVSGHLCRNISLCFIFSFLPSNRSTQLTNYMHMVTDVLEHCLKATYYCDLLCWVPCKRPTLLPTQNMFRTFTLSVRWPERNYSSNLWCLAWVAPLCADGWCSRAEFCVPGWSISQHARTVPLTIRSLSALTSFESWGRLTCLRCCVRAQVDFHAHLR